MRKTISELQSSSTWCCVDG